MHIILQKNVEELAASFELKDSLDRLFEIFCNYCVVSNSYLGRFDPQNITTKEDDASLDGLAVLIDNELILTEDDAKEIFDTHKTNFEVKIILTQVKSGEVFAKDDISNFGLGVLDFLSLNPSLPNGTYNTEVLKIIHVILENLKKVKNKLPSIEIYFATSGNYNETRELKACFEIIKKNVVAMELFHDVKVGPLDRKKLTAIWNSINKTNETKIKVLEYFGMPPMSGIDQSYVTLINVKEFVDKVLLDSSTKLLKHEVFEENIRAYLGADSPVNEEISNTIKDDSKRQLFSVLNNGITIITPDLTLTPNSKEIELVNYQIINGCQTSNTLFENYSLLDEDTNVVVKCIETSDEKNISEIISATNSQTTINGEAFFSLKEKTKLVQRYFDIKNSETTIDNHLYFERRENEYKVNSYQQSRIFDIKMLCRAYNSMFLDQPHTSSRYINQIFEIQKDNLFINSDQESFYYASALCLYRFNSILNGKKFSSNKYAFLKWHIIYIYKYLASKNTKKVLPNSKAANPYALKIIETLLSADKVYEDLFKQCFEVIDSIGFPTRDVIKRSKYQADLFNAVEKKLKKK